MRRLIQRFHDEHVEMKRMLVLFETELDNLRNPSSDPDYYLLLDFVRYFTRFPELMLHPTEKLLLRHLQFSQPELAPIIERLNEKYRSLIDVGGKTSILLESACSGHLVPRPALLQELEHFSAQQGEYIDEEESHILSNAEVWMTSKDWVHLESDVRKHLDPVTINPIADELKRLREEIYDSVEVQEVA